MKTAFMIIEQRNPGKVERKGSEMQPLPLPGRPGPHVRLTLNYPQLVKDMCHPRAGRTFMGY